MRYGLIFLFVASISFGIGCDEKVLALILKKGLERSVSELHGLRTKIESHSSDPAVSSLIENAVEKKHAELSFLLGQELTTEQIENIASKLIVSPPAKASEETIEEISSLMPRQGSFEDRNHPSVLKAELPKNPVFRKLESLPIRNYGGSPPAWNDKGMISWTNGSDTTHIYQYLPGAGGLTLLASTETRGSTRGVSFNSDQMLSLATTQGIHLMKIETGSTHLILFETIKRYAQADITPSWSNQGIVSFYGDKRYRFYETGSKNTELLQEGDFHFEDSIQDSPRWNDNGQFVVGTRKGKLIVGEVDTTQGAVRVLATIQNPVSTSAKQPPVWGENGFIAWDNEQMIMERVPIFRFKSGAIQPVGYFGVPGYDVQHPPAWGPDGLIASAQSRKRLSVVEIAKVDPHSDSVIFKSTTRFPADQEIEAPLAWGPEGTLAVALKDKGKRKIVLLAPSETPSDPWKIIAEYYLKDKIRGMSWGPDRTLAVTTEEIGENKGTLTLLQLGEAHPASVWWKSLKTHLWGGKKP